MRPAEPPVEQSSDRPSASPDNENLRRVLRLTRTMMALADEGDRDQRDSSCAILFGMLRDMAYKLRRSAEDECEKHRVSGRWD
jgi:hypothetical protein